MPIDELAAVLERPQRFLGMHWFNPPQWTPAVEVVPAPDTDPEVPERVAEFLRALGKAPTIVGAAVGFIANRLQSALLREAVRCVQEGLTRRKPSRGWLACSAPTATSMVYGARSGTASSRPTAPPTESSCPRWGSENGFRTAMASDQVKGISYGSPPYTGAYALKEAVQSSKAGTCPS